MTLAPNRRYVKLAGENFYTHTQILRVLTHMNRLEEMQKDGLLDKLRDEDFRDRVERCLSLIQEEENRPPRDQQLAKELRARISELGLSASAALEQDLSLLGEAVETSAPLAKFPDKILQAPVHSLAGTKYLNPRISNLIQSANINCLGELFLIKPSEFMEMKNFGKKSYTALVEVVLSKYGIDIENISDLEMSQIADRLLWLTRRANR